MPDDNDLGPPGPQDDGGRPPPGEPAHAERVVTTTTSQPDLTRTDGQPDSKGLRRVWRSEGWMSRRRQAAQRLEPLACLGRCRDPLTECRWCERPPPRPSERMVDGGRAAALHLLNCGLTPILGVETRRALWRRGGDDRALAQQLYELAGDEVA